MATIPLRVDFEMLKRLPPVKRVQVLQELAARLGRLIEKHKKEIEAKQREIEEAQDLLDTAREELAVLEQIEIPAPKVIKVEELFGTQAPAQEGARLEEIAQQEAARAPRIQQPQYWTSEKLFSHVERIYQRVKEGSELSPGEQQELSYLRHVEQYKQDAVKEGAYSPDSVQEAKMTAAERMLKKLDYHR